MNLIIKCCRYGEHKGEVEEIKVQKVRVFFKCKAFYSSCVFFCVVSCKYHILKDAEILL